MLNSGSFFLCGALSDSNSFTNLIHEQMHHLQKCFHLPETFMRVGNQIISMPMD